MATITENDLMVCLDCTLMVANGECGDETETAAHGDKMDLYGHYADRNGMLVIAGDEHEDFSTVECDGCGDTLAGERFSACVIA